MAIEVGQRILIDGRAARRTLDKSMSEARRRRPWHNDDLTYDVEIDDPQSVGLLVWDDGDSALLRSLTYCAQEQVEAIVLEVRVPYGASQRRVGVRLQVFDRPVRWRRVDFGDGTYVEGYVKTDEEQAPYDFGHVRDEFTYEIVMSTAALTAQNERNIKAYVGREIYRMEHQLRGDDE